MQMRSLLDLLNIHASAELSLTVRAKADVEHGICDLFDVEGGCQLSAVLSDLKVPGVGIATCDYDIHGVVEHVEAKSEFNLEFIVPPLLELEGQEKVGLRPPDPNNPYAPQLEFGSFQEGKWQAAEEPLIRVIPYSGRALALGAETAPVDPRAPSEWIVKNASHLTLDLSVGAPGFRQTSSAEEALVAYQNNFPPLAENEASIEIGSSLFGDVRRHGESTGIFGSVLPLRIHGRYQVKPSVEIDYDLVLVRARAGFGRRKSDRLVGVEFEFQELQDAKSVFVRNTSTGVSQGAKVKSLRAEAILDLPQFDASGKITSRVRQFEIMVEIGSAAFSGCFRIPNLVPMIETEVIPVAKLRPALDITLPDCIGFSDPDIKPKRPCREPMKQRGAFSNSTKSGAKLIFHLDKISGPEVSGDKRSIRYRVPLESTWDYAIIEDSNTTN